MRKTLCAAIAAISFIGAAAPAVTSFAQPRGDRYFYNGHWVTRGDWERRQEYRNWNRDHRGNNNLAAGILGFALGAAIVGSQDDARYSYTMRNDRAHRAACFRDHGRSYDPASNTFLGGDGYRHYCR